MIFLYLDFFLVSLLRFLIKRVQRLSALTNREAEWEMSRRKESNIEAHGWFKWFPWDHESGFNIFLCEEPVRISAAIRQCLALDLIDDFHFNWNELPGNANRDILSFILPYSKVRSTGLFLLCVRPNYITFSRSKRAKSEPFQESSSGISGRPICSSEHHHNCFLLLS